MRRSGGPEPCAACSSTSACGEQRALPGRAPREPAAAAPSPGEPQPRHRAGGSSPPGSRASLLSPGLVPEPKHLWEGCQPPRAAGAPAPFSCQTDWGPFPGQRGDTSPRAPWPKRPELRFGAQEGSRVCHGPTPQPCRAGLPHGGARETLLVSPAVPPGFGPTPLACLGFPLSPPKGHVCWGHWHNPVAAAERTWMRRMTAWCILHMSARDGLSIRISTAWMGPAGLRSFMATWDSKYILTAIIARQGRGRGQPQDPSPWAQSSPRGSPPPSLLPAPPPNPLALQSATGKCRRHAASPAGHIRPLAQPLQGAFAPSLAPVAISSHPLLQPRLGTAAEACTAARRAAAGLAWCCWGQVDARLLLGVSGCPFPDKAQAATPADLIRQA